MPAAFKPATLRGLFVDRVEPLILQGVGPQLVDEADAAPLLTQIEQEAPSRRGDGGERVVELRTAIAFQRSERVARQAFAVQPHQRRLGGGIADQQRDMLGGILLGTESDDFRLLGEAGREPGARGDEERRRAVERRHRVGRERYAVRRRPPVDEESGQKPGAARQADRRVGPTGLGWGGLERPLERILEIERRIGERRRPRQVDPGSTPDAHGASGHGIALVAELERRRPLAGNEDIGRSAFVEQGEPSIVGGLDGEEGRVVDDDRPAAPQRVDGAGDVSGVWAPAAQMANSVTSGTWSDGRAQLRQCSWTVWPVASFATSGDAHIWSSRRPRSFFVQSGDR